MATRLPTLAARPIAFAHRGARAHAPENTIEAFVLARRLGATGIESDVWVTADGIAVLDHDGLARRGVRRRSIAETTRAELPEHIPTLVELYEHVGTDLPLSLDVKDDAALEPTLAAARAADAAGALWLCHPDVEVLEAWRPVAPDAHLVHSTHLKAMQGGQERHAARLRAVGIDAVNLHHSQWSGGLTTLFHRFEVLAFGWDAQHERILDELFDMGIDALYSDHVDRMVAALVAAHGE